MTATMKPPTQTEVVLRLTDAPGGACMETFHHYMIPRYSARLHELRQAGYTIATTPCERHDHHGRRFDAYVLVAPPYPTDDTGQERMF